MITSLELLETPILVIHFIVSVFLIITILLQAGKGADIGATFGAGGSQSLFGARGAATFLSKLTTIGAIIFLLTSFSLALIQKQRGTDLEKSVIEAPVIEENQESEAIDSNTSETPKNTGSDQNPPSDQDSQVNDKENSEESNQEVIIKPIQRGEGEKTVTDEAASDTKPSPSSETK